MSFGFRSPSLMLQCMLQLPFSHGISKVKEATNNIDIHMLITKKIIADQFPNKNENTSFSGDLDNMAKIWIV